MAVLLQYFLSKLSLWYFRNVSQKKITLIRKQGIGDAIFATGVLRQFQIQNPDTKIKLVTNHPKIFTIPSHRSFAFKDFPWIWMTYAHYDFSFLRKTDKPIRQIIAEHLGLKESAEVHSEILLDESIYEDFTRNFCGTGYVVIHPWAGGWNLDRNWSIEKWNSLVHVLTQTGLEVYQIGGGGDVAILGARPFQGRITLEESIILIKHTDLFIGVNSFGEQAAGVFGVQSLILYGPTNPVYSLNPNQIALSGNKVIDWNDLKDLEYTFERVDDITSEFTIKQALKLLNEGSSGS